MANTVVDLFRIDTAGRRLGLQGLMEAAAKSGPMDTTATTGYTCEIDGTDNTTGSAGDVTVECLWATTWTTGGTTVWVWTGDDKDTVDDEHGALQARRFP